MNRLKQKTIKFKNHGRILETVVIADRTTWALHPQTTTYLLNKRQRGSKITSLKKYASVLLSLLEEINIDPDLNELDDLTDATMSAYLEKVLIAERSVSTSTLKQHISTLSDFFSFLYEHGWTENPCRFTFYVNKEIELKSAKINGRQNSIDPFRLTERYIPKQDFEDLLRYDSAKKPFERRRNEIIFRLGYQAGLRASEIVSFNNLTIATIKQAIKDSEHAGRNEIELRIIGKGHGMGKVRTIVIEPPLRRKVERFIRDYSKVIGPNLITNSRGAELDAEHPSNIFRWAKEELIRNAPLKMADKWSRNDRWSFHSCRHSYATNLSKLILDKKIRLPRTYVQDRLGHSDERTTMIYTHFAALLMDMIDEADNLSYEITNFSQKISPNEA